MSAKFWRRTLRNVVLRNQPSLAHLAVTHRCNLRCAFCQIPLERTPELDLAGMKAVVDRLDRLGVAVVSLTGGEPLLRRDCVDIANYAASRGLFAKVSSNGTAPRDRYAALLRSAVCEVGISLDGVNGEELPYRHDGAVVRDNLRYVNDHLPPDKRLMINVTVCRENRAQVEEIVAYCTREYPRARIWLNPVVVGEGKLRVNGIQKVHPGFLRSCKSPTLLCPDFYARGCRSTTSGRHSIGAAVPASSSCTSRRTATSGCVRTCRRSRGSTFSRPTSSVPIAVRISRTAGPARDAPTTATTSCRTHSSRGTGRTWRSAGG